MYSTIISSGNLRSTNSALSDFYDTTSTQTIGKFFKVDSLIHLLFDSALNRSTKYIIINNAITINNSVSDIDIFESNQKTLNDVYLSTIALEVYTIDLTQLDLLNEIADQCPYSGGRDVFNARGLLKLSNDTLHWNDEVICNVSPKYSELKDSLNSNLQSISLYPNPTTSAAIMKYHLFNAQNCHYEITNPLGERLLSKLLNCDESIENIDLHDFKAGIYYVQIFSENEKRVGGKIVVIK